MNAAAATLADADIARLAGRYRERAQKCERTAKVYLLIIIGVLLACILIFAGADRLAGMLFKTQAEREADAQLREAEAQLHQATMEMLRSQARTLQEQAGGAPAALPPPVGERPAAVPPAAAAEVPALAADGSTAAGAAPGGDRPLPAVLPEVAAAPAGGMAARQPARGSPEPRQAIQRLQDENAALRARLAGTRAMPAAAADPLAVEALRRDTAVEVAQIRAAVDDNRAAAERDAAQARADADRAIAGEATRRAEDLNALIASSVARVGSVVIVILLVRIFLRDRQRLILLAGFYLGVADAIEISGGDVARLKDWLPQLVPPQLGTPDEVDTPLESVLQALVELARRGRG